MANLSPQQETPLILAKHLQQSTATPAEAGVKLGELALLGYINLRGQGEDFAAAVQTSAGLDLPRTPNTLSQEGGQIICWLGPDEWLLITPSGEQSEQSDALRAALEAQHAAVTDISGGLTTITVSGKHARAVLAKGCPLDLHPRVFSSGRCAQTLLAKAPVLLIPQADKSLYVVVRRSFADYLWHWLVDAAEEYDLAVI